MVAQWREGAETDSWWGPGPSMPAQWTPSQLLIEAGGAAGQQQQSLHPHNPPSLQKKYRQTQTKSLALVNPTKASAGICGISSLNIHAEKLIKVGTHKRAHTRARTHAGAAAVCRAEAK